MKILITGSRTWTDPRPVETVIKECKQEASLQEQTLTVIHGNAPRGADKIVEEIARKHKVLTIPMNANWTRYGRRAGFVRNQQMINEHPDINKVYAYKEGTKSAGTEDMIIRAQRCNIPIEVLQRINYAINTRDSEQVRKGGGREQKPLA